jgi:hypothetical protein
MVIVFGLLSFDFGRVTVRIPFSKSALARSAITSVESLIERSNAPQRCSRMNQDFSFFSSSCFTSPSPPKLWLFFILWLKYFKKLPLRKPEPFRNNSSDYHIRRSFSYFQSPLRQIHRTKSFSIELEFVEFSDNSTVSIKLHIERVGRR